MSVSHVCGAVPEAWDAAVHASGDTWLFHISRWLEITADVFSLTNHFFIIEEAGRIVAGMPLQVTRGGRRPTAWPRGYSIYMGSGGPFTTHDLSGDRRDEALEALSQAVIDWARRARIGRLDCFLPPLALNNMNNFDGDNPLARLGWNDCSTKTMIKDLSGADGQLASLRPDSRRRIRRAEERGYTVAREPWPEMLDAYYETHVETYRRTGAAPHPKCYFEGIARDMAPLGGAVLWVCRTAAGEPVAFHNSARFGNGSVYWTGCSRTEHAEAGVNYLLFWHAIAGAREDGCRYYEVGEVFPDTADKKLQGLTNFKTKFGGARYPIFRGEYAFSPRGIWLPWLLRAGRWN